MKRNGFLAFSVVLCLLLIAGCAAADPQKPVDAVQGIVSVQEDAAIDLPVSEGKHDVVPLPGVIHMDDLNNVTVAVSLEEKDVWVNEAGILQMNVTVYDYDLYDMVDMSMLQAGDTIQILGEEVLVTTVDHGDGVISINGGLDAGGYEFVTEGNTVYYERGYSDVKSYYELGSVTLPVAESFVFTDASDLDHEPVHVSAAGFIDAAEDVNYHFVPHNTKIVIENGSIAAMERIYMP